HQNVAAATADLRIRVVAGKRVAAVWTNRLAADGLAEAARPASGLGPRAPANPPWDWGPPPPITTNPPAPHAATPAAAAAARGRAGVPLGASDWPARRRLRGNDGERGRGGQLARHLGVPRRLGGRGPGGGARRGWLRLRRPGPRRLRPARRGDGRPRGDRDGP